MKRILTALLVAASVLVIAAPASAAGTRVAIGQWYLETFPGLTRDQALADQAAFDQDSTLTATNTVWLPDAHLVRGEALSFNGTSSVAASAGPVLDTTGSFSVAAWVRPADLSKDRDFVGQDYAAAASPARWGGFSVGIRHKGKAAHWSFRMGNTSNRNGGVVAATDPQTLNAASVGRWTHVAASYDAASGQMTLYVNGAVVATVARPAAPWAATGPFIFGRSDDGGPAHFWKGEVSRALAYDRVLTTTDLFGGTVNGFNEGGLLDAWNVEEWSFNSTAVCYLPEVPDTCNAPSDGPFSDILQLTFGTDTVFHEAGLALSFDDTTFVFDADGNMVFNPDGTPAMQPSVEYAYLDAKIVHTDAAFSVAAQVRVSDPDRHGPETFLSLGSPGSEPAFEFAYVDGAYTTTLARSAATGDAVTVSIPAPDAGNWHQLLAVYDPFQSSLRVFLDGVPAASASVVCPAETGSRVEVGRSTAGDGYLFGAVSFLKFWQGTLTDRQIAQLAG